jgi:hypothetical protein
MPNGLAQRQRQSKQNAFAIIGISRKPGAYRQRRSRCPLEPVLGTNARFKVPVYAYGQDLVFCIPLFCIPLVCMIPSQIQI